MSTIEERVKKIVAEQLGVKEEEVTNSASFVEDLGADSLDTVELVMALEEEFEGLFVRIHRSTLASMHFIESLECSRQGRFEVHLRGVEEPLPVSRRHMAGLRKALTGKKK